MRALLACLLWAVVPALAQDIVFATASQGRVILSASDAYSKSMSDFDRSARLATPRQVSESEYLAFAAKAARDWSEDEKSTFEAAFKAMLPAVVKLGLPLPERVWVVKTSGDEDAGAAYTRQNAIVFPQAMLGMRGAALHRLVAHELFHVATRAHPKLADPLYAVIGFQRCGAVALPPVLASRRVTNPDAPRDEHCIEVTAGERKVWALPLLVSVVAKEELATSGPFLRNVTTVLLLVERKGSGPAVPLQGANGPLVAGIEEVSGFFEQVGRNTQYIIHPEEIVADNFALLAMGAQKAPSPEILKGVERVLAEYRK